MSERRRMLDENARRRAEVDAERYAPWNPTEIFFRHGRRRLAAVELHRAGVFPAAGAACLEIGCGEGGWLPDLIGWGVEETSLHGVDLDPLRLEVARRRLPAAHFAEADASALPFGDDAFDLVIASTVLTSILDDDVRRAVAGEIERVLCPGGALLWYDFAVDNPRNPNVRGIGRGELKALFSGLEGGVRSVTLAPPLARRVVPRSWWLAELLQTVPLLRTHLLAVLRPSSR